MRKQIVRGQVGKGANMNTKDEVSLVKYGVEYDELSDARQKIINEIIAKSKGEQNRNV